MINLYTFIARSLHMVLLSAFLLSCSLTISLDSAQPTPQMSPEEYAKFMEIMEDPEFQKIAMEFEKEFVKLPKEVQQELNNQARKDLEKLGLNVDVLEQQFAAPPQNQALSRPVNTQSPFLSPPLQPAPAQTMPFTENYSERTTHSADQASDLLNDIITHAALIKQRISFLPTQASRLQEILETLSYQIKIMNTPEHIKRLTSETFDALFLILSELASDLRKASSHIIILHPENISPSDDPYAILQLPLSASDEEIEKRYQHLSSIEDPRALEEILKLTEPNPEKRAQRLEQAHLRSATIQDAYERLARKELRTQIIRYRSETVAQQAAIYEESTKAAFSLQESLDNLIHKGLLNEVESFIKKHEPTEQASRTQRQQLEQRQKEEQLARDRITPLETPRRGASPFFNPDQNTFAIPQLNTPPRATYMPPAHSASKHKPATTAGKKEEPRKKDPKKPDVKKDGTGTDKKEEPKKKEAKDLKPEEKVKKEFETELKKLNILLKTTTPLLESGEGAEIIKAFKNTQLSLPAKTTLGTQFDIALAKTVQATLTPQIRTQLKKLATIATTAAQNKHTKGCATLWEEHLKDNIVVYTYINTLAEQLTTKSLVDKNITQSAPWSTVHATVTHYSTIMQALKKPSKEKEKKEKKEKQDKKDRKPVKPVAPILTAAQIEKKAKEFYDLKKEYDGSLEDIVRAIGASSSLETPNLTADTLNNYLTNTEATVPHHTILSKLFPEQADIVQLLRTSIGLHNKLLPLYKALGESEKSYLKENMRVDNITETFKQYERANKLFEKILLAKEA